MNHTVSKDDADQFARSKGIEHVQASALSGNNVDYIFTTLAEKMMAKKSRVGATTWTGWPQNWSKSASGRGRARLQPSWWLSRSPFTCKRKASS